MENKEFNPEGCTSYGCEIIERSEFPMLRKDIYGDIIEIFQHPMYNNTFIAIVRTGSYKGRIIFDYNISETKDCNDIVCLRNEKELSHKITKSQKQLLILICKGLSGKEIAAAMSISLRTIENKKNYLFAKLKLKSTLELGIWAIRNGIYEI